MGCKGKPSVGRLLALLAAIMVVDLFACPTFAGIVPVGEITDMVVDPVGPYVFVAEKTTNRVAVVDINSESIVQSILAGPSPGALALDSANHRLYVANRTASYISIVDLTAGEVLDTIPLTGPSQYPVDLALGRPERLYVACYDTADYPQWCTLHIVDTNLRQDLYPSALSNIYYPLLAISPDRTALFIGQRGLSPASLSRADVTTDTITITSAPWNSIGSDLNDMALSPDGIRIYLACGAPYYVQALNALSLGAVGSFSTGAYPRSVAVSPDGWTVFATHSQRHADVFSAASFAQTATLPTNPAEPDPSRDFIRVSSDGTRLLVAEVGSLEIIPIPWPTSVSISIDAGAASTVSPRLDLTLAAANATQMSFLYGGAPEWTPWEPFSTTKQVIVPAVNGSKRVWFRARNAAATAPEVYDDIVLTLETTPPTDLSIQINAGAEYTTQPNVTLTLAAQDPDSGVASMSFQYPPVVGWTPWESFATGKQITLPRVLGTVTVSARFRDWASNISETVSDDIFYTFEDVPLTNIFFTHVQALRKAGVTSGCAASPPQYCPTAPVTRAQIAKFLCLAAGKTELFPPTPTFADVHNTDWFYGWVERLADPDSWDGTPPTTACLIRGADKYFCPYGPALREQMAKLLCIAAGKPPMPSCSGTFADVAPLGWACEWIERLADAGSWPGGVPVTSGCACPSGYPPGARCYCPKEAVTRGQMAKFLVLAFDLPL